MRARARALGLSDAEVARRAGLTEPRYGHYVAGSRRPDYATLVRLCRVLGTSPNVVLGFEAAPDPESPRAALEARLMASARLLAEADLKIAVQLVEVLTTHRGGSDRAVE